MGTCSPRANASRGNKIRSCRKTATTYSTYVQRLLACSISILCGGVLLLLLNAERGSTSLLVGDSLLQDDP
jgi:hypothetical protein